LQKLHLAFGSTTIIFDALPSLHFAHYNFVRQHRSLRTSPAMAAGVERNLWTVRDLVERTSN
jgi:hypothetical protein